MSDSSEHFLDNGEPTPIPFEDLRLAGLAFARNALFLFSLYSILADPNNPDKKALITVTSFKDTYFADELCDEGYREYIRDTEDGAQNLPCQIVGPALGENGEQLLWVNVNRDIKCYLRLENLMFINAPRKILRVRSDL